MKRVGRTGGCMASMALVIAAFAVPASADSAVRDYSCVVSDGELRPTQGYAGARPNFEWAGLAHSGDLFPPVQGGTQTLSAHAQCTTSSDADLGVTLSGTNLTYETNWATETCTRSPANIFNAHGNLTMTVDADGYSVGTRYHFSMNPGASPADATGTLTLDSGQVGPVQFRFHYPGGAVGNRCNGDPVDLINFAGSFAQGSSSQDVPNPGVPEPTAGGTPNAPVPPTALDQQIDDVIAKGTATFEDLLPLYRAGVRVTEYKRGYLRQGTRYTNHHVNRKVDNIARPRSSNAAMGVLVRTVRGHWFSNYCVGSCPMHLDPGRVGTAYCVNDAGDTPGVRTTVYASCVYEYSG
jgi:hypothetical protein